MVRVKTHEVALWHRFGDFVGFSGPGEYRVWSRLFSEKRRSAVVLSTLDTRFPAIWTDVVSRHPDAPKHLHIVALSQTQRAIVWKDGRIEAFIGPGRYAFWKAPATVEIETFDTATGRRFAHPRLDAILGHPDARNWLDVFAAPDNHATRLVIDGLLSEIIPPGKHVFWKNTGTLSVLSMDLREQTAEVAGQEIMTGDKVTLRITLILTWRVTDASKAISAVTDAAQTLYREAQLALRAAVGSRSLDQLLADKDALGLEIAGILRPRAEGFGIDIRSVGVRDIILPGEMKTILNQVIEAEKRAQADLIRRREETASARSQANTAKLMADNPTLARLKEFEMLQDIIKGSNATFVLGSGDLLDQFRALMGKKTS